MHRRLTRTLLLAASALAVPAPGVASAAPVPYVAVSVATKDGTLIGPVAVRPNATRVKVGGKRCAVGASTPLAALVALKSAVRRAPKVGTIRLKDYGTCGRRPSASSRLYLTGIGADRASGPDGWIYTVNGKSGSTSAADPAGPFGRGRIKARSAVNWRWCRISEDPEGDCGDALEIGTVTSVSATQYLVPVQLRSGANGDENGTVTVAPVGSLVQLVAPTGAVIASTNVDADGVATLSLEATPPPGSRFVARVPAGVGGDAVVAPAGRLLDFPAP